MAYITHESYPVHNTPGERVELFRQYFQEKYPVLPEDVRQLLEGLAEDPTNKALLSEAWQRLDKFAKEDAEEEKLRRTWQDFKNMATDVGLHLSNAVRFFSDFSSNLVANEQMLGAFVEIAKVAENKGIRELHYPPVNFDLKNEFHKQTAQELNTILTEINFDEAYKTLRGPAYGMVPPGDDAGFTFSRKLDVLLESDKLTKKQKLAIQFFVGDRSLTGQELAVLFEGHAMLLPKLYELDLVRGGNNSVAMNDVSLISHRLPNDEVMYIFTDVPKSIMQFGREPKADISTTSFILLDYLQKLYSDGQRLDGVVADFGSGVGVQAIALLMMHPAIEEAVCLEIENAAMNLNKFNAMLNGVGERTAVVNNIPTSNFNEALRGRKLSFAVTNPPYNIVPKKFSEHFPGFGDGGEWGMDITKIFLEQVVPELKDGAQFVISGVLAEYENNDGTFTPFLSNLISFSPKLWAVDVNYGALAFDAYNVNARNYSAGFVYMVQKYGDGTKLNEEVVFAELQKSGIDYLRSYMVTVTKKDANVFPTFSQPSGNLVELPTFANYSRYKASQYENSRGGVYKSLESGGGIYERVELKGGISFQEHSGGIYRGFESVPDGGVFIRRLLGK